MRSSCCLTLYPSFYLCLSLYPPVSVHLSVYPLLIVEAYEITLLCLCVTLNFLVLLCGPCRAKEEWAIRSFQNFLLAYFSYLEKSKSKLMRSPLCLCLCETPSNLDA
jgi:hypothetical protein